MNMIMCEKDCAHQKDGCCALNSITSLSGENSKCGYYESRDENAFKLKSKRSPSKEAKSLL